jgi:hypothetical protein
MIPTSDRTGSDIDNILTKAASGRSFEVSQQVLFLPTFQSCRRLISLLWMTYVLLSLCDYYYYSQRSLLEIERLFNKSVMELMSHNQIT